MTKYSFLNELDQLLSGLDADERKEILEDYEEHFAFAKRADKSDVDVIALVGTPAEIASEILGSKVENAQVEEARLNNEARAKVLEAQAEALLAQAEILGAHAEALEEQAGTQVDGFSFQVGNFVETVTETVTDAVGSAIENLSGVITETFEANPDDLVEGAIESNTLIEEIIDMSGVKNVVISAKNQKIEIEKTTYPTARVRLTRGILATRVEGDTLHIEAREIKRKFGIGKFITIELPAELKVELPEMVYELIEGKTENAKIEIKSFELDKLDLESKNGKVEAKMITGNELKLKTINGGVELKDAKGNVDAGTTNGKIGLLRIDGTIYAQTSNGKIELEGITGNINGHTSNGKIELKNETISQDVKLSTSNAKIEVRLANKPENAKFDLSTSHARARLFGMERNHEVLGDGTHEVNLSTSNGKIDVYETSD